MRRGLLALLFVVAGMPASAQSLPAYYDVTGVAAGDVLNIRAAPAAASAATGSFAPTATGIEVVRLSEDGKWALVSVRESSGWVALRYLTRAAGQDGPITERGAFCHGTEPFWAADLTGTGELTFTLMDGPRITGSVAPAASMNRSDTEGLIARFPDGVLATGVLTHAICSDGMSDRLDGLSLDLILSGPEGDALYSGCCSLR